MPVLPAVLQTAGVRKSSHGREATRRFLTEYVRFDLPRKFISLYMSKSNDHFNRKEMRALKGLQRLAFAGFRFSGALMDS